MNDCVFNIYHKVAPVSKKIHFEIIHYEIKPI